MAEGAADDGGALPEPGAAFYARRGRTGDWWTILHPPYTAWHLSYVLFGAALSGSVDLEILGATLLAFLLAVGVAAHALDEWQGRPLGTAVSGRMLLAAAALSLTGALALGVVGVWRIGGGLIPFIVLGAFLVLAYNLEWFGGRVHTDLGFALAWGAFPVLTSAYAQLGRIGVGAVGVAIAATGLSLAQRVLSTQVRHVRRGLRMVEIRMLARDGSVAEGDARTLLRPIERALRLTAWSLPVLGLALVAVRL
ncbi:MAG: hypothetical protein JJT89_07515 [Nitriliruptoraceae bacterium]|nr:hypothetical protein [Nitriliruptoraceae bacterium]